MTTIIVNVVLIIAAIFVVYWFWLSQAKIEKIQNNIAIITVKDGVYTPANLHFNVGDEINLEFLRIDKSACAEVIFFKELNKQYTLPLQESFHIKLGKLPKGVYYFSCQMNMYQGTVVVT